MVIDTSTDLEAFLDRPSGIKRPRPRLSRGVEKTHMRLGNLRRDSDKAYSMVEPSANIVTIHPMILGLALTWRKYK